MKTLALVLALVLLAAPVQAAIVTVVLTPEYGSSVIYIDVIEWHYADGAFVFTYSNGVKRIYPGHVVLFVEGP